MTSRITSPDTDADRSIREILDEQVLGGFTVIAGAGSGKTTSLVKALAHVTNSRGRELLARTQRVACITYTEVAAREIHDAIGNDPLASVSTIHSFLWALIKPFQKDIGLWASSRIDEKLALLAEKQGNYSNRTKVATREKDNADLEKLQRQRSAIAGVKRWSYGIAGDYAQGMLGHSDVLRMVPELIMSRTMLARLVARQFPFIFVDESQDTFPEVVRALKHVSSSAAGKVCLGFFGDPMQQIYAQGVGSIEMEPGWRAIEKPENFRSSRRVLACVNTVRADGDLLEQSTGLGQQAEGEAFGFILPADGTRSARLDQVRSWLEKHSSSGPWTGNDREGGTKVLMIVHRMAARRLGFGDLYAAFHDNRTGPLGDAFDEGNAWPLAPFRDVILPLCLADTPTSPSVLSVLKQHSPLIRTGKAERQLRSALISGRAAVEELRKVGADATLGDLLRVADEHLLIDLDPRMAAYLHPDGEHGDVVLDEAVIRVLDAMGRCRLSELLGYYTYVKKESPYSTQHGTKGSEFERVVVVLDDEEGQYNLYSYDKLLGIKALSATDIDNQNNGIDSAIERTRRLFYVCVSRARESLAIVLFTADVGGAEKTLRDSELGRLLEIVAPEDLDLTQ